jgi:hypothetical protein
LKSSDVHPGDHALAIMRRDRSVQTIAAWRREVCEVFGDG